MRFRLQRRKPNLLMKALLIIGAGMFGAISLLFVLAGNVFLATAMGALALAHAGALRNGANR